ncbi:MAG: molybdopterin-binding protein, partial [Candidatus Omnitrophota bacterium]
MTAEIIACGTELLLGHGLDTNSAFLSNILSSIGIDVFRHITVGDNKERLRVAIEDAFSRADIVIITGGLGPTVDDITIGTLSSAVTRDLVFNKAILKHIKEYFKRHGSGLPKSAIKQALIPRGAEWLVNNIGTAPGLIIKEEEKYLIALPGPPRELEPMVANKLLPYL